MNLRISGMIVEITPSVALFVMCAYAAPFLRVLNDLIVYAPAHYAQRALDATDMWRDWIRAIVREYECGHPQITISDEKQIELFEKRAA